MKEEPTEQGDYDSIALHMVKCKLTVSFTNWYSWLSTYQWNAAGNCVDTLHTNECMHIQTHIVLAEKKKTQGREEASLEEIGLGGFPLLRCQETISRN